MTRSCSILLFDFEKDLASVIDAAYTGDHSIKVFNPVTGKCTPHLSHGKGTRDGKSAHFFPAVLIARRIIVFIVNCSTGCLRMVTDVSPLVKNLENLTTFARNVF